MTSKLTITRERLAELVAFKPLPGTDINSATRDEWMAMAEELQARRKADSEPVAWVSSEALDSRLAGIEAVTIPFVPGMDIPLFRHPVVTHDGDCDADLFGFARRSGDLVVIDVNGDPHVRDGMPLYRHAQQPVVPDAYARDERGRMMLNGVCEPKIGFGAGWNACRAAMLNGGQS